MFENAENSEFLKDLTKNLSFFSKSLPKTVKSHDIFPKSLKSQNLNIFQHFTSNLATFQVRSELLAFHKEYYSSSVMKLAVVGKEDLETLSKLVTSTFSSIQNTKRTAPQYGTNAFTDSPRPILHKICPIADRRDLRMNWVMDSCFDLTLSKPTSLLSYCLGDESPGSILSYLKAEGLATALMAGPSYNLPEFTMMNVTISMTPSGLERVHEVIGAVYQYLERMRALKESEWKSYFVERAAVREMQFNFKGKEKSYRYSRSLAMSLQRNFARERFLELHGGLMLEFDAKAITKCLSALTPNNCFVQIVAKEVEGECKSEEKWYGTKFVAEQIEDKVLSQWMQSKLENDKLHTPKANKYIATDFSIHCDAKRDVEFADDANGGINHGVNAVDKVQSDEVEEEKVQNVGGQSLPYIIRETEGSKMWFKMDDQFKRPKLCVSFRVYSPALNDSKLAMSLTDIVVRILNHLLSDSTYAFEEAALSFSASFNGSNAINFKFSGFNEKLHLLVETVMKHMHSLAITDEVYQIILEQYQRVIASTKKSQPYSHCDMIDTVFLCPKALSLEDLEANLKGITMQKVVDQHKRIMEQLFVESLVYGNVDAKGMTMRACWECHDAA